MNYRIFQYPLPAPAELDELNACLASERVASVAHQFVQAAGGPMLVFLVQTVGAAGPKSARSEPRVDYRALLDDQQFALFSRLRTARKEIADEEGVPVYTIFSNAQLAEMVKRRASTPADLSAIDGLGQARIEKYGERMLAQLANGS